jgi:transcriptional regulator of arginine metabolism
MPGRSLTGAGPSAKQARQRAIRELVARMPMGSQEELVERLAERGFAVTQATVSRDIAELQLVKVARGERHVYVSPDDLAAGPGVAPAIGPAAAIGHAAVAAITSGSDGSPAADAASATDLRLQRLVHEAQPRIGRSGLTVVLRGPAGSAQALALAIDQSSLQEPEGTLAGDDTVLVLFADEARLERWLRRFRRLAGPGPGPA